MTMHPKVFLAVKNHKGEWVEREPLTLYPKDQIGNNIEIVSEYQGLRFRFESSDPNDELLVEKYDSDTFHVIKPGELLEVKKSGDADNMLVPGDYPVIVRTAQGNFETLYRIRPHNFSWEQLVNLRIYLEQKLTGLAYNILRRRSGSIGNEKEPMPHPLKAYQYIQENFNQFRHQLEIIVNDPIKDVIQVYDQRNFSRKPDPKSQRWLSKRGSAKNANVMTPMYFYEKHTQLTVDTIENRWVKYILRHTKKELKKVKLIFDISRKEQKSRITSKMGELNSYRTRFNRITSQYGFNDRRKELDTLIKHNENELVQLQEGLIKIDQSLAEVNKYIFQFSRYEQVESLSKVSCKIHHKKPTLRLLKERRYAWVYRFYKGLKALQTQETSGKATFPYKKTSLLFEYFVLCLVIDILEESGFYWTEGWLADYPNPELALGNLTSGTLLRFIRLEGDFNIELAYDTQIFDSGDESISQFKANIKRAPDIRVSIYKNTGEFISTLILDAKYRHYSYLWDEREENDVMKQLSDYLRIWHYDANKPVRSRIKRDAVCKVIAVYPKQSGVDPFFEKMDKTLGFVQIAPAEPKSNEEPFGYNILRTLIGEFLSSALEDLEVEVI